MYSCPEILSYLKGARLWSRSKSVSGESILSKQEAKKRLGKAFPLNMQQNGSLYLGADELIHADAVRVQMTDLSRESVGRRVFTRNCAALPQVSFSPSYWTGYILLCFTIRFWLGPIVYCAALLHNLKLDCRLCYCNLLSQCLHRVRGNGCKAFGFQALKHTQTCS